MSGVTHREASEALHKVASSIESIQHMAEGAHNTLGEMSMAGFTVDSVLDLRFVAGVQDGIAALAKRALVNLETMDAWQEQKAAGDAS